MKKYPFDLNKAPTKAPKKYDKDETKSKILPDLHDELYILQRMLYAQQKYSILMVFQGMDAAGKNSMVKRVFYGVNPVGCQVFQFTKPTEKEYQYDFLWRVHQKVPPKGMIHIFNRSHYEDILVPSVL
jgi:polyphosphate kinase 2 (PPK2 family)